jgi:formylglycine-generating enzyme required for sulfatase activity
MVGNLFEWVEDCRHENYAGAPADGTPWLAETRGYCDNRVIRSAANGNPAGAVRSAFRSASPNGARVSFLGFRVARTLETR